ncbi:hypothetical protein ACQKQD_12220 [Methylobacterium sp. NPDC080182]|uniref:hypothetical protein n=1 Tax=Methylobacterium sp. NPDC080182 TaxID=3390590 RepID=UPI003D0491F1
MIAWSGQDQRFEYRDAATGLMLFERVRGGLLEHACAQDGEAAPVGAGWRRAVPRLLATSMALADLEALLDVMACDETAERWTTTAHICGACKTAPLEAQRPVSGSGWMVRCPACGATGEHAHANICASNHSKA